MNDYKNALKNCIQQKMQASEELQNDINQVLASVLLWIEHTKLDQGLKNNASFEQAENNLRIAIEKVRKMHYKLGKTDL
ncbi:MAG: hypothetical protein QM726_21450 [Chitinophagaceae bacterium]